jgi:methylenetetrahydromethanopterin dehydrogenase
MRICIAKLGAIGTAVLLEYLLDERAERNLEVRVVTGGAKMGEREAEEVAKKVLELNPDLVVVASPNATLPGPTKLREILRDAEKPVIVVSDSPVKKICEKLEESGFGYIVITADSMIGARREFLDPSEMALYNSYMLKVLSATGALRVVQLALDRCIESFETGNVENVELPHIVVDAWRAVEGGEFSNPYALAKAFAAYSIAEKVSTITTKACFVEKKMERYIPMVTAAHEMMRYAAKLADEARELEKSGDSVLRTPHAKDGKILRKRKLMEKPS